MSDEGETSPSDPAPSQVAGEDMHIHKPKAAHSLREFLSEISVIVVGIAIAIGGEQTVEALHWRHEVAETQDALRLELADDRVRLELMRSQDACYIKRLDDLDKWAGDGLRGRPTNIGRPYFRSFHTSGWDVAKASQAASHIPLTQRFGYSSVYDMLSVGREAVNEEREAWTAIVAVVASSNAAGSADRMRAATAVARDRAKLRGEAYAAIVKRFNEVGVGPYSGAGGEVNDKTLCKPLVVAAYSETSGR